MEPKYNIPGYIALFSLASITFLMLVGFYDILEFAYKIVARLTH